MNMNRERTGKTGEGGPSLFLHKAASEQQKTRNVKNDFVNC